jgi:Spx/MgsR family transcriptional regulator
LRNELGVELEERDYARNPLTESELRELFGDADASEYLNPRSPTYKQLRLKDRKLTGSEAIKLMAKDPNLIKRPLVAVGKKLVAGFDRDRLRQTLG